MKAPTFITTLFGGVFKNILMVSLAFGFLFLAFGYTDMVIDGDNKWKEVFKVMGTIILSSGVFMAISKSYQFTNIFKDELRKVIYAEEHLENRTDLDVLWQKITDALCKRRFSNITNKLIRNIKDYYLPINQDYYYKNYDLDIDVEYDPLNSGYVYVTEEIKVTIVTENKKECNYNFKSSIPFPKNDAGLTFYCLEELKINDKKIDLSKQGGLQETKKEGYLSTSFKYKCIPGKQEYNIVRREKKRYALSVNPYRLHKAICLYHNFSLDLSYPKNMDIEWIDMGVLGKWSQSHKDTQAHNRIKANYNGLIFRNQGFLLMYR